LLEDLGQKHFSCKKLVPNLMEKKRYIVSLTLLKLYIRLGATVTKIHRMLQFDQSKWMEKYILFNTEHRKNAKNNFEKDLFKLFNNAVFGKAMQNKKKQEDIILATNEAQVLKAVKKPSYRRNKVFSDDLVAIQRHRVNILLDKPI